MPDSFSSRSLLDLLTSVDSKQDCSAGAEHGLHIPSDAFPACGRHSPSNASQAYGLQTPSDAPQACGLQTSSEAFNVRQTTDCIQCQLFDDQPTNVSVVAGCAGYCSG